MANPSGCGAADHVAVQPHTFYGVALRSIGFGLGGREGIDGYGKGAIVGTAGEIEHAAALIHPRFGAPVRKTVVKGDDKVASIAAASILAKEHRDRVMRAHAETWPHYGWDRNAGYPTREHVAALQNLGVTPAHRRSFKPVHNILYQENSITC